MHITFFIINILLFIGYEKDQFDLKADLKKDDIILQERHGRYVDRSKLSQFELYANLNLSKFKFDKRISGKHSILKWTSASGAKITIYEVKSIVPSDTIYQDTIILWDSVTNRSITKLGEKVNLKPSNFAFHTFIIQPTSKKPLIYMTEQHEGLMEYHIGDKIFYPVYEDIVLGLKKPDIKEILKLIAALR